MNTKWNAKAILSYRDTQLRAFAFTKCNDMQYQTTGLNPR